MKIILFVTDIAGTFGYVDAFAKRYVDKLGDLLSKIKDAYGAEEIIFGLSTGSGYSSDISDVLENAQPYLEKYNIKIDKSYYSGGYFINRKCYETGETNNGSSKVEHLEEYVNELKNSGYEIKWFGYADDAIINAWSAASLFGETKVQDTINNERGMTPQFNCFTPGDKGKRPSCAKQPTEGISYITTTNEIGGLVEMMGQFVDSLSLKDTHDTSCVQLTKKGPK